LSFIQRLFGRPPERQSLLPLYEAVVTIGRDPAWYLGGGVPDTLEGRFDMVTAVLTLVLLRLEAEGESARRESALLAELFIDDMDSSLRELGTGDMIVGKKVGKLMGALGGRLGSFRDAARDPAAFEAAVRRNVFREAPMSEEDVGVVAGRLAALRGRLSAKPLTAVLAGELK
jgi:cytochrome b pre-mRNA-processing protein 3